MDFGFKQQYHHDSYTAREGLFRSTVLGSLEWFGVEEIIEERTKAIDRSPARHA